MIYPIPYKSIFALFLLLHIGGMSQAQNFENGNLEGEISGSFSLPDFWNLVPHTDVNCLAGNWESATPDLASTTMPVLDFGIAGTPYSGNSFIYGGIGTGVNGLFFHEGIMQMVSGFELGHDYKINFYQSVISNLSCRDTSGSWAVFLNDSLLEISTPSSSLISYMSIDLEWEERTVSFIAQEENYLIKFLPWDDDLVHICDSNIINGSLGMGIDCIRLTNLSTSPNENLMEEDEVKIYPNPTTDFTNIELADHNKFKVIQIIDVQGRILREYLSPVSNQMRIELPDTAGVYLIKVVTENGSSIHKVLKI